MNADEEAALIAEATSGQADENQAVLDDFQQRLESGWYGPLDEDDVDRELARLRRSLDEED